MSSSKYENDELIFLSEDIHPFTPEINGVWNVLVVDDDEEIHSVTRLALSDLVVNEKALRFFHAYSGVEALEIIEDMGSSIAIILLDVVMESDDAGLNVAKKMREELKIMEPRIILRTGQPGYAPEEQVIKDYDINDYKTKTELTRSKLVTTIIASLRSYQQILTINQSRLGLQQIIVSAANLMEEHSIKSFCEGVVTQISSLIGLEAGGVVCARAGSVLDKDDDGVYILGAAGEFASYINERLDSLHNARIVKFVNCCLQLKEHIFEKEFSVLYLNSSGYEAAVYLQIGKEINSVDQQLLEVFLSSISVGYENVNLFHQLRTAAFRDWLTKLPNRSEFINMLDDCVVARNKADNPVVALIDINHFADINDGLGQDAGNSTLLAVTNRLEEAFLDKVRIGRIGSDVFGLIGAEFFVNPQTLNEIFVAPFKAGEHTLPLSASFGFCRLDGKPPSGINILKHSNIALNKAKKNLNTNFEYYAPEMEEETTWRLDMIRQLTRDFQGKKLQLWYQPQVDLVTEQIVGMEALLRWPTSDGGFVSPAVFVPLAEYSGLIIDIGIWVLEESCKKLKAMFDQGHTGLRMAVNISMPQFRDPNFIDSVKNIITEFGIQPDRIELEITESVVMDEPQIVIEALQELKLFGVKVAIDDFGTGFSSMSYLQQLPLDRLKVDRSFVNEIHPGKSAFIAETIVTLGNKLGLSTIAEGVEKREQASYMLKLGCDEAQGYLFAKPMPYEQLLEFLASKDDN
ncbi:bifunctional diguanylate cyclase/phosphodiesterase [Paraglaciecola arctica]|uniref:bifunctional diguanylate cyclase/phosphodiesterase n=1 Tax=Paraglaciecola arctica TaxID=1128911 RepID=UPI001C071A1B|nr:EAL domain-containing protein [Paraglaciecola arctica]MBU3005144.1 EAL domain-containing protein [Paraglaciecola arctica]